MISDMESTGRLIRCCECGVPVPEPPCPDPRPTSFCLFHMCDACVERLTRENAVKNRTNVEEDR